jgi:hypothetical protein
MVSKGGMALKEQLKTSKRMRKNAMTDLAEGICFAVYVVTHGLVVKLLEVPC